MKDMLFLKIVGLIIMLMLAIVYEYGAFREKESAGRFWMAVMAMGCMMLFGGSLYAMLP